MAPTAAPTARALAGSAAISGFKTNVPSGGAKLSPLSSRPYTNGSVPMALQDSDDDMLDPRTPGRPSTDPEDRGFGPSTVPRSCTDACWIIPFVICLGLFVYVSSYALQNGDLSTLLSLPDRNGNLCGHGLNREKPFLYFCMQQNSQWAFEGNDKRLDMANPICVGICPGNYNTSSRCWLPLNQSYAWVQDYPTRSFIGFLCRPSRLFTQAVYEQFQRFVETAPPVASFSMVIRAWETLAWVALVSLLFSYGFIAALSFCANCIVLAGVMVVITATTATSAYLFWCARPDAQRTDMCGASGAQPVEDTIAAVGLLTIGGCFLCLACQMSAWMETAVQCIQWSCKCILETPSLYLLPPVTLSARGLLVAGHIYVGAMLSSAGISKYKWIVSYSADSTWASAMLELSPVQWACFFGTIFMGIWAQGIVTAWTIFVTDYTSQMWYFSGGMSNKGSAPMLSVARAGWLGIRYHAGSMIGGGLKLMIALPWRISLGWLEETTKNQYNPVGAILGGCCDCFLHFYRRFFHVMSRHAFLDVSLQASPFDEAARHALSVLESESSAVSVLNGATWTFQIVGLGTIASIGHLVTTFEIQSRPELHSIQSPNYVQQPELLCMAGAVLAFAVAFPFMMMFDVVSDSILFCRSVQKMRHQANKPGVSAMMPDLDRACGPTNGMISRIVGCYCAGRDRQAEDWGLLSNMSWNSTSDTASPPRSRPQEAQRFPAAGARQVTPLVATVPSIQTVMRQPR